MPKFCGENSELLVLTEVNLCISDSAFSNEEFSLMDLFYWQWFNSVAGDMGRNV